MLYELTWGTLEYLESDTRELAQTKQIFKNPRVRSYQEQIHSFLVTIEELSQQGAFKLAPDRYVLYLEVFHKMLYVNLDALFFISNFLEKISKFNVKKVSSSYLEELLIFIIEMALIAHESENTKISNYLFQLGTSIVNNLEKIPSYTFLFPLLGLALNFEKMEKYREASKTYHTCLKSLKKLIAIGKLEDIPLQLIHEISAFGYMNSYLAGNLELTKDFLNLSLEYSVPEVKKLLNQLDITLQFGVLNFIQNFPDFDDITELWNSFDFYFKASIVTSNQNKNSMKLEHLEGKIFFPRLISKLTTTGAQKGILVVESEFLKDIQIFTGKHLLPSLNVIYNDAGSSYVKIQGHEFTVSQSFVLGKVFEDEIEINVHYKNQKGLIKRNISVKDGLPAFFQLDISKEIKDLQKLKEGGIRHLNTVYTKDMSLVNIIQKIALIPFNRFEFENEQQEKEFLKTFSNIFKKLGQKKIEIEFNEMVSLPSTISGKALKLVILQRLTSTSDEESDEIVKIIEQAAKE